MAIESLTLDIADVDWPPSVAAMASANAPDADLLRRLMDGWSQLTPNRRWRLVELMDDMRVASGDDLRKRPVTD